VVALRRPSGADEAYASPDGLHLRKVKTAWLPWCLVAFRGLATLVLLGDGLSGRSSWWFVPLFAVAFLTDIFDGMIARRLGVVSPALRKADGIFDTLLYLVLVFAAIQVHGSSLTAFLMPSLLMAALLVALQVFSRAKFGRGTSFHGWSAKLWGLSIAVAAIPFFSSGLTWPLWLCLACGLVNIAEEAAMVMVLPEWRHDVWSLIDAIRLRDQALAPSDQKDP